MNKQFEMSKHWAQKRWEYCTPFEKAKTVLLWAACLVGCAVVFVVLFFLKSFRWSL